MLAHLIQTLQRNSPEFWFFNRATNGYITVFWDIWRQIVSRTLQHTWSNVWKSLFFMLTAMKTLKKKPKNLTTKWPSTKHFKPWSRSQLSFLFLYIFNAVELDTMQSFFHWSKQIKIHWRLAQGSFLKKKHTFPPLTRRHFLRRHFISAGLTLFSILTFFSSWLSTTGCW